MDESDSERRVENLHNRLREATEHVEQLRREAQDLAADLRNQLHALALQRQAVQRLDSHRRQRIEDISQSRGR
jgi:hypothetical protein